MKPQHLITLVAACLSFPLISLTAYGADGTEQLGQPVRAKEIIGSTVKGIQGEKLGTVKDVAVDLPNGRIVEVFVAHGGFLGADQKILAVPPQSLSADPDRKGLRLNLSKETLEQAPAADLANWSDTVRSSRVEEVYRYYGFTPYFTAPTRDAHDAANPIYRNMREVDRAETLFHLPTVNNQGENIGEVADLILDFPAGRVVEAFIASGHFLGVKDEMSAVPPQILHFDADRGELVMDASSDTLFQAPHFPAKAAPQIDADQAGAVYRAYHVTPYFFSFDIISANESTDPSEADMVGSLDFLQDQASKVEGKQDKGITAQIKTDIQKSVGLSPDARKIKVRTVDGNVTLSGTVADADEKGRLERIAAHYAAGGRVVDQLVTKPASGVTINK